jgi:protein-S-isoprenylcysteine O-methyltransferase Ste14
MKPSFSPPFLYKLFIALMLLTVVLPIQRQIHLPISLIGIILFVAGSYVAIATKKMFKRTQTPISHHATANKLHTKGIFRYTRNPMYLGIVIGLTGIAILTGIVYNLIFALVYLIVMDICFIRPEEKQLYKVFGETYTHYKKKTRRWL